MNESIDWSIEELFNELTWLIYLVKEKDSEVWFVQNELHTISIGQTTHQAWVKKFGLRRILFDKSCLQRMFFHTKSGLQRMIFIRHFLFNHSGMYWPQVFYSLNQFIGGDQSMVVQSARITCFRGNSILFPSSGGNKLFKHNMIANRCCST